MHGLIHSNGFGHLISLNGIEGGSKFLCGREVMDRISTNFRARKITLELLEQGGQGVLSYIRKTAAFWQRLALSLTRNLIREVRKDCRLD